MREEILAGPPGLEAVSGVSGAGWDEKQRRSALRSHERVMRAIEKGEWEEARSITAKSLAATPRSWERTAPHERRQPVAWIVSDRRS